MMVLLLAASLLGVPGNALCAQSAAVRRLAREIVETFGRETVERAEPRVARLIEEYGDDAIRALRRAGSPGVETLERFGVAGARIVSRWGDDGVRVLAMEGEAAASMLSRFGDDAVAFMVRHPGAGRDLLEQFGAQVLRAPLSTESVVALNRLSGPIRASGRSSEILGVVERFGDRACSFLWRNKGTLFATAVLVSFLADPQPYLDGVKQLIVQPAADLAGAAVRRANWTVIGCAAILGAMALLTPFVLGRRKSPGTCLTRSGGRP